MTEIVVEGLCKWFDGVAAVDGVTFTVHSGELVTLLGPSGCGKTTTLNCIAGLEQPDEGTIRAGGKVLADAGRRLFLPPEARNVGMVFQSYALWPHMTVFENLAFPLRLRRLATQQIRERIERALALVQLEGFEGRYPHQLSGGQQQRVALARALVYEPAILLLDEPLSNLDAKLREQARFWLRALQQRLRITTVYVTHDQAEALSLSDRVLVMNRGRIAAVGTPQEIYERPADPFVADFIGSCNFLRGKVLVPTAQGRVRVRLEDGTELVASVTRPLESGQAVWIVIRPHRIHLIDDALLTENVLAGEVRSGLYLGALYQYVVETPVGTVRVEVGRPLEGRVRLHLPSEWTIALPAVEPAPRGEP
jgi:iron(III) transport system ATP-binding protein